MKKKSVKRKTPKDNHGDTTFKNLMEHPKNKFTFRHVIQVIIGATLFAVPVGFTEETWRLGEILPMWNILIILFISLLFVTIFAYRNFAKKSPGFYWVDLVKRIVVIYILSFVIVALLLTVIQKAPWGADSLLALKRTIIVTFPSSLSATIAGSLK